MRAIDVLDLFLCIDMVSYYEGGNKNYICCHTWPNEYMIDLLHNLGWRYEGQNIWRHYSGN